MPEAYSHVIKAEVIVESQGECEDCGTYSDSLCNGLCVVCWDNLTEREQYHGYKNGSARRYERKAGVK